MARVAILDDYQQVALQMADWKALPAATEVQVFQDHLVEVNAVAERLKDFNIVVAMRERTPFPRALLEQLPNLRLLITTGMRNASIDVSAATDCGVMVCGTGGLGYPTAELTWGLILALARQIPQEDRATRSGHWQVSLGLGLQGKVLGVIGLGRLGSQVAAVGKAFGMSLLAWSQNLTAERASQCGATLVSKDGLLSQADFVTLHLVLSDRSRGIIGARELALMQSTAYLLNTSRGPLVHEQALVQALQQGSIAGAGLDVFDEEPLPLDHPLRQLENTVITPHLGYVTRESYEVFYGEAIEAIQAFLRDAPVRVLNAPQATA
ncbi:Hydroxypyruvate reductase [Candidatus Entotheonellaceae bacterium PAL068K]